MAVLGCQPISLFPAWSCQWKSCWKNSRKELSFLHSADQVNTLPRVSLKRLLWCFRVEKCILNVKRCLVIFKTEHENLWQKERGTVVRCIELRKDTARLCWEDEGPYPACYPVPGSGKIKPSTRISPADCATSHCTLAMLTEELNPLLITQPACNSVSKSCMWQDIAIFCQTHLKEKFACFKTRLGGRGIILQLHSACS